MRRSSQYVAAAVALLALHCILHAQVTEPDNTEQPVMPDNPLRPATYHTKRHHFEIITKEGAIPRSVVWEFTTPMILKMQGEHGKIVEYKIRQRLEGNIDEGRVGTISAKRQQQYPGLYSPPAMIDAGRTSKSLGWVNLIPSFLPSPDPKNPNMVVPMTPSQFGKDWVGIEVMYSTSIDNGMICLLGTITVQEIVPGEGVFGEGAGPLYTNVTQNGKTKSLLISENTGRMQRRTSWVTNFQLNAISGKTYKVTFLGPKGNTEATVKCTWP
ncbi:MAG: hypothetical protein ABI254_14045 [Chthoniobacterales bacterium]